ncbi:MAG: TerC family protein [Candidatus Pacebacteria bacterium]|nr:TerC family protein [Candidatus Paceibacterota bacterium]
MLWIIFSAVVIVALLVDFFAMSKQGAHRVSLKEAGIWSAIWVALSFLFVGWLWWYLGGTGTDLVAREIANTKALEFITGYFIEKALAVDNIFVFLLVFTYFAVPREYQKRLLMFGILFALVLRAAMIFVGAWLISEFHWVLYLFGLFLMYTGIKMWRSIGKEPDFENSTALKWLNKSLKISPHMEGEKLFTRHQGVKTATPLFAAVVVIGVVDLLFAVDSIPAIFAVTTDSFIVLTSNVFAILGLRAMYFLLAGLHERFHLLSYGLAIILLVIGAKMLLMDIFHISVVWSLVVTMSILLGSILLSLVIKPSGVTGSAYPFKPKEEPEQPRADS